ncbi:glucose-1-phosphate cytidylyltransferase [Ruegeria profundi]|uniref:glucose-1-phosphate cytidylyltransferase n=1 Tax=Ruegeria profundi TaxID=1685378 RepID=UPI001CD63DF7|nr:glucose-1-phosphate cytidylyltransferase [Ruegeria profundi]MCA0930684.1 glucose-1-phosphate cytidylyltransferase [Ruegeria profundi]
MKVAILAGGLGSRLSEETDIKPKPMVEIGGKPILWHIMMHYYRYGFDEFVIALGYKGDSIKRWMIDFSQCEGDLIVSTRSGVRRRTAESIPDWHVDLVETGLYTNTGGRIKRLAETIGDNRFMLTWGDGVSDINLHDLLRFHEAHGKLATMTAVRPPARFGHLLFAGDQVTEFNEKPQTAEGWINGAFFVLEPKVFDYIDGDTTQFEKEPLERLAADGELMAYRHDGFWQCMDTLRDKRRLQKTWEKGHAPWMTWEASA